MVKIKFGDQFIELTSEGWRPSDEELQPLADVADQLSKPPFYEYAPSHGAYGPRLANAIVNRIGGRVIVETSKSAEPPLGVMF